MIEWAKVRNIKTLSPGSTSNCVAARFRVASRLPPKKLAHSANFPRFLPRQNSPCPQFPEQSFRTTNAHEWTQIVFIRQFAPFEYGVFEVQDNADTQTCYFEVVDYLATLEVGDVVDCLRINSCLLVSIRGSYFFRASRMMRTSSTLSMVSRWLRTGWFGS